MKLIKIGSRWKSIDRNFVVTDVVENNNNVWIHYKNSQTDQEYSCYQESFVHRFIEIVNGN